MTRLCARGGRPRRHVSSRTTLIAAMLVVWGVSCSPSNAGDSAPIDALYYPAGIAVVEGAVAGQRYLVVANSNFDKRYPTGTLSVIPIHALNLPPIGQGAPPTVLERTDLQLSAKSVATVSSFAGAVAVWPMSNTRRRVFVPARSEGSMLNVVDFDLPTDGSPGASVVCPAASASTCAATQVSLEANETTASGLPRAPAPYGVALTAAGRLFLTHLVAADSPAGTLKDTQTYVATSLADQPKEQLSFLSLGSGATGGVVAGARYAYVAGRYYDRTALGANLVRLVAADGRLVDPAVEVAVRALDARGIALASDERRLYLAVRSPDALLVFDIVDPTADVPALHLRSAVPLAEGPNEVLAIRRDGQRDLVAVGSSTAGVVTLYDDQSELVVEVVRNVGLQPAGLAVARDGVGARIFVSAFGEGRVSTIDIADVTHAKGAFVSARLGKSQLCLTRGRQEAGCP